MFKNTDDGANWSAVNNGLTIWVIALAINPQTPITLYAGTWGGGVFSMQQVERAFKIYLPIILRNR